MTLLEVELVGDDGLELRLGKRAEPVAAPDRPWAMTTAGPGSPVVAG